MTSHNTGARYFAAFMMTSEFSMHPRLSCYLLFPAGYASGFAVLAWIANTIPRPRSKRAAGIAIVNACGNIGSIPGAYIWPIKYGPYYRISFGASLAILGTAVLAAFILRTYLVRLNKKLERNEVTAFGLEEGQQATQLEGETPGQAKERVQSFRYLY